MGGDETEGKIWSLRQKVLKRERAKEAPRCQVIGEETKSREYPKSKKRAREEHSCSSFVEKAEPMLKA